jgi:peptide/nickel transport system permease protein
MRQFILKRLGQSVLLLFLISLLVFGILQLVPGGPLDQLAFSNPRITPEQFHNLEKLLGLDRPAHERYFTWLLGVLHGDLGSSWSVYYGRPVLSTIVGRLPLTLELMVISTIIALLIAIPVGILAAVRQYSRLDYAVTALSYFGISMPVFWFGLMMIVLFAVELRWLPTSGVQTPITGGDPVDLLRHLVLPVTVLSIFNVAQFSRYIRSSMLEVLKQDYIRTARAKGLIERFVILKHGLRNGMIPLITLLGLELPVLFSGAVITETIFSWPGMGRLFYDAIVQTDWPLVQGILLFSAFLVLIGNLFADVMYAVVDPRIRY